MKEERNSKINKHVSLNMSVRGIGKSSTLAINELSNELLSNEKKVYKLGLGQSPFPVPEPVVDALRLHAHEKDYLQVEGLRDLRAAVARFHRRKDDININPKNVLVGPGSKELMFLLQLVFYGEILIPTPCWVSYIPQAKIIGRNVHLIHTSFENKWHITPTQLAELCEDQQDRYRPRILILNYPTNPDGGTYSPEELKSIAQIAKKFEVIVLSDEIYGQIHHDGKHVSIARYYPNGTIISSGLSKWCGAGGWRLGTFAFPTDLRWLMNSMASVASETYTSVCAPIQFAAVRAFRSNGDIERYLFHIRRILKALGMYCYEAMTMAGVRVHPPEGAFYLFLDFTPFANNLKKKYIETSGTLTARLLEETGVAMLPGEAFGRPAEELTARMAYVNFDGSSALAASEAIPMDEPLPDEFIHSWCNDTVQAMQKINEWLSYGK
jgi:aspartate aminotransferase